MGNQVFVDKVPLVHYHFAKVKRITPWCIATRLKIQAVIGTNGLNKFVYKSYANELKSATEKFSIPYEWIFNKNQRRQGIKHNVFQKDDNPKNLRVLKKIILGEYVTIRFYSFMNLIKPLLSTLPRVNIFKKILFRNN
jgi:hypothetical protein